MVAVAALAASLLMEGMPEASAFPELAGCTRALRAEPEVRKVQIVSTVFSGSRSTEPQIVADVRNAGQIKEAVARRLTDTIFIAYPEVASWPIRTIQLHAGLDLGFMHWSRYEVFDISRSGVLTVPVPDLSPVPTQPNRDGNEPGLP
jgi:hypothetical protein